MSKASLPQDLDLVRGVELKKTFRDAYERRAYVRAYLLATRLLADPQLLQRGKAYLERFVRNDPHQRRIYDVWTDTLRLPMEEIVRRLLTDDEQGEFLRGTAPVFVVIPADEVRSLARSAA